MDSTLALLVAGGSGLAMGKIGAFTAWAQRRFSSSVMLYGEAYQAVAQKVGRNTTDRYVAYGDATCVDQPSMPGISGKDHARRVAPGTRLIQIDGIRCLLSVEREKVFSGFIEQGSLTVAKRHQGWLRNYVEKAISEYRLDMSNGLPVFSSQNGWWEKSTVRPFRPLRSIRHSDQVPSKIIELIRMWQACEQSAIDQGENWHIGFLLHGDPGTGKTSTAIAIASELKRPLYVLSPDNASDLGRLLSAVPSNAVLLVEECEEIFPARGDDEKRNKAVAAALSYFDGPLSKHGIIRFYTTNHRGKLDPAFLRYGRADYEFEFTKATSSKTTIIT